jgi:hypothetical protein
MSANQREHRIRALAYRIHQLTGSQDAQANWYRAATLVDTYPSHDFDVRKVWDRYEIFLVNKDSRHCRFPL